MMNKIEKLIKTKTENCNSFFVATHMFEKKKKKITNNIFPRTVIQN